jgi:hypothetical protein
VQQLAIETIFITRDEFFEARFPVSRKQIHPRCCERLVVNVRRAVMRGESLKAFPDQRESFVERLAVEQEPGKPQVIPVTEQRRW